MNEFQITFQIFRLRIYIINIFQGHKNLYFEKKKDVIVQIWHVSQQLRQLRPQERLFKIKLIEGFILVSTLRRLLQEIRIHFFKMRNGLGQIVFIFNHLTITESWEIENFLFYE